MGSLIVTITNWIRALWVSRLKTITCSFLMETTMPKIKLTPWGQYNKQTFLWMRFSTWRSEERGRIIKTNRISLIITLFMLAALFQNWYFNLIQAPLPYLKAKFWRFHIAPRLQTLIWLARTRLTRLIGYVQRPYKKYVKTKVINWELAMTSLRAPILTSGNHLLYNCKPSRTLYRVMAWNTQPNRLT